MVKIVVTGGNGQLGQALQSLAARYTDTGFYFLDSAGADITDAGQIADVFDRIKPDFCINTAAYTAVDKAEAEPLKAYAVNVTGAKNVAAACKKHGTTLIHISTDFVFDGLSNSPYKEEDSTNPQSVYGRTKLEGELEVKNGLNEYYIIRTSCLYSQYGHNFMKTMLRLGTEKDSLSVVNDQRGTPTNANDLARAIFTMILSGKKNYGLYHYSNEGEATWYDFARKIFEINNIAINLKPIPTASYPTPAKRPAYSVLDKDKIKKTFNLVIPHWEESLGSLNVK